MRKNEVFDGKGNVISSVEIPYTKAELAMHLETYGSAHEKSAFIYEGFTEDATSVNRTRAKEAIDFLRELGENAPTEIPWNSENHGVQIITLDVLLGWLMGVGMRRFKRFAVQTALKDQAFTTKEEVEAAFDAGVNA